MFFLSNIPLLVLCFEDIFLRCSISCNNCSWRAFCSSFDGSCSLEVPPKSASVLLFFRGLSWRLLASSFVVCFCASFRKAWTSSFGIWQAGSQVCPSGPYPFHEINSSRLTSKYQALRKSLPWLSGRPPPKKSSVGGVRIKNGMAQWPSILIYIQECLCKKLLS